MRLLDLFCGAGGATKGYQRAGFYVVGVDIKPQPRYCGDAFVQMDALEAMEILLAGGCIIDTKGRKWYLADFAAIAASPPCQEYSSSRHLRNSNAKVKGYRVNIRPRLIEKTRAALDATGKLWVIENVAGSPLPSAIELCGSMFGLPIQRHRWFESSTLILAPGNCRHTDGFYNAVGGKIRGYGAYASQTRFYIDCRGTRRAGEGYPGKAVGMQAMGIDWMTVPEMCEAIPPAYTEHIGRYLIEACKERV